jgi:phage repressor protein C with HTH and peptisase S24 domain
VSDYSEQIRVHARSAADFAVKVSGDSMEPLLHDGGIAYVKQQPAVEDGETGLFYVDGKAYIKQYWIEPDGTVCLRSYNRERSEMDIALRGTDEREARCFGKVI